VKENLHPNAFNQIKKLKSDDFFQTTEVV